MKYKLNETISIACQKEQDEKTKLNNLINNKINRLIK